MIGKEIRVSAVSEIGLCKRENQDRILARIGEGPLGDFGLFAVADGMGGQAGGEQAAETALQICEDWWQRIMPRQISHEEDATLRQVVHSLVNATQHLNEAVMGLGSCLGSTPGTTFSALFLYGHSYGYVHVGDSRIYKAARSLEQLTQDDTWVCQQVRAGVISAVAAASHPKKHILTQCAGSHEKIHIHQGSGLVGNATGFILCSDGFYHHLSDNEMKELIHAEDGCNLLRQAVATIYSRGATDNLSAIVVTL